MWNNRAMSNRYWISVAAVAAAAALAGVYVARIAEPARRAFTRVGHICSRAAAARRLQPRRYARRTPLRRRRCAGTRLWCSSASRTALTCAPRRSRCSRACRSRWRMPGLKVALISVDPERDTPGATRQVHLVIRRRSYRPHGHRARDCEDHEELWRGGEPRRSSRRQLHHGPFGHDVRARLRRAHRRGVHAAVQCRRTHARRREARAGVVGRSRLMSEAPRRRRPRVRRASAPAAATRHLPAGARRDALARAGFQERADPAVRARLQART